MEGGSAAEKVARLHARFGTTSLLATTMTAPPDEIEQVLRALGSSCRERRPGGARILGVHLEGPYINPGKLGAQPDDACRAVMAQVDAYRALAPVSLITLAPEIAGHMDIIRQLARRASRCSWVIPWAVTKTGCRRWSKARPASPICSMR